MDDILTQNPCYESGVEALWTTTENNVLYNTARMANELLNEWNTNVAFLTLADNATSMRRRIRNRSTMAKFHAVKLENPDLQSIIHEVEELANSKFVRAFFIYGITPQVFEEEREYLDRIAKSLRSYMMLVNVVDQAFFDEQNASL